MPLERDYQRKVIQMVKDRLPGVLVFKMDPSYRQGTPDLLLLWGNRWAMLEVKKAAGAARQPNQEYYIDILNQMSFAAVIYPENARTILDELQSALMAGR